MFDIIARTVRVKQGFINIDPHRAGLFLRIQQFVMDKCSHRQTETTIFSNKHRMLLTQNRTVRF